MHSQTKKHGNSDTWHRTANSLHSSNVLPRDLEVWWRHKSTIFIQMFNTRHYRNAALCSTILQDHLDWNYPVLYLIFSFIFFQRQWRAFNILTPGHTSTFHTSDKNSFLSTSGLKQGMKYCKNNYYSSWNCKGCDRGIFVLLVLLQ